MDAETIVEPFGGSFAVIKHHYKDTDKYNFHINDTDPNLLFSYIHYDDYINAIKACDDYYEHSLANKTKDKTAQLIKYMEENSVENLLRSSSKQRSYVGECIS